MIYLMLSLITLLVISFAAERRVRLDWLPVRVLGTVLLLAVLLIWGAYYADYKAKVHVYYTIKDTIEHGRNSELSEIERAALLGQIIEVNTVLARAKYWNGTLFRDAVPTEFADLEYLK